MRYAYEFAKNLKQGRNEKGLTQEGLAELLGVSRQAVSKWEQREGHPEIKKLILLSKVLDISLDWLFAEEPIKQDMAGTHGKILSGIVAGLETFSSAISNLMGQTITKTNKEELL